MENQAAEKGPATCSSEESSHSNAAAKVSHGALLKKKARHGKSTKQAAIDSTRPPCRLAGMPLEILAEILSYVPNPAVILSLARCSKYFCHALVNNPSTAFIWRDARKRCRALEHTGELPEPTANFTEASYAAFVFDGGKCEICGKYTRRMYESFCLRARICNKPQCKSSWAAELLIEVTSTEYPRYKGLQYWLPNLEVLIDSTLYIRVRKSDWSAGIDEYNKALLEPDKMDEFLAKKQSLAKQITAIRQLSKALNRFKKNWELHSNTVKESNETVARSFATREGWTAHEMIGTPTYGLLHRSKTAIHELVKRQDYDLIRDQVDREIAEHRERVARRKAETAYQMRREDVAAHYNRLKSDTKAAHVLPTLPEFRKLSVMKVLQGKASNADEGLSKDLKDSKLVNELLADNLRQWREDTRTALAGVLGFSGWKSASKNKLHPVDRLTARFVCKKCTSKGKGGESLNFAAACKHRCAGLDRKQKARETWSANLFEPDTKAIDAVTKIVALLGFTAEDPNSKNQVDKLDSKLVCTACPAPIAMTLDIAVLHCKRHESPTFDIAGEGDPRVLAYALCPIPEGLATRLLGRGTDAQGERAKKTYACRHCQQAARQVVLTQEPVTIIVAKEGDPKLAEEPSQNIDSISRGPQAEDGNHSAKASCSATGSQSQHAVASEDTGNNATSDINKKRAERQARKLSKNKPFNFDGLRSHLKEKHGILHIGDEDVYEALILA